MKRTLVVLTAAGTFVALLSSSSLFAALSSPSAVAKQRAGFALLPPAAPAGQTVLFGHIKKLTRKRNRFELRFDPALFTSGVTASRAALEDTGSSDVPNDNYVIEEGHRLLTYLVPTTAHVTVITNDGSGIASTAIPVSELARIVNGGKHRRLFES